MLAVQVEKGRTGFPAWTRWQGSCAHIKHPRGQGFTPAPLGTEGNMRSKAVKPSEKNFPLLIEAISRRAERYRKRWEHMEPDLCWLWWNDAGERQRSPAKP